MTEQDPDRTRQGTNRRWSRLPGRDRADIVLACLGWFLLVLFLSIAVVPGLIPGHVFLGTDVLSVVSPWAVHDSGIEVHNRISWDTIDSATPMAILIVDSVRSGTFPLWDPFNNGGTQLASLPNSGLLSPLSLPWWVLPHTAANAGVKFMEAGAVALGMQLLLRRQWSLPRFTVPFATIVFLSSGFMVAWTNWPQTRVAAMIPLLFWATDRLALGHRLSDLVPLALVVAAMLLGGFPAVLVYSLYTAVVYFFVRVLATGRPLREVLALLMKAAAGVTLGLGLAAVQVLPFAWQSIHYVDFEARAAGSSDPLPTQSLASVFVPTLLGGPSDVETRWLTHPVEGFSYLGAVAIVLVVVALLIRPRTPFPRGVVLFLSIGLVVMGWAVYGGGPLLSVLQALPMVSSSPIGRIRSVLGFLAAVLAALGLAAVFEAEGLRAALVRLHNRSVATCAGAVVRLGLGALIVIPVVLSTFHAQDPLDVVGSWNQIKSAIALIMVMTALVTGSWLFRHHRLTTAVVAAALVLTTTTSTAVAREWWTVSDSSTFYPGSAAQEYLDENLGADRYISVMQALMPGTSSAYQERALSGHAFVSPEWRQTMDAVDPAFFLSATYSTLPVGSLLEDMDSGVLDRYAVRFVVAAPTELVPGVAETVTEPSGPTTLRADGDVLSSPSCRGPVRGIFLTPTGYESLASDHGYLTVDLVSDLDGSVLTSSTTNVGGAPGLNGLVALAGEEIGEDTPWHAEARLSETAGSLDLALDSSGNLAIGLYRPADDNLTLVHAGDATILRRDSALPRVRWADQEMVVEDAEDRVKTLESGSVPADAVVLEDASDAHGLNATSTAVVSSEDVSTDEMTITVDADGPGWVVVADPLRDGGWHATLDGDLVDLVPAENAGIAIWVPSAGHHSISLTYSAPWFRTGLVISLLSLAGLLLAGGVSFGRSRSAARGFAQSTGTSVPRHSATTLSSPWAFRLRTR